MKPSVLLHLYLLVHYIKRIDIHWQITLILLLFVLHLRHPTS